MRDPGCLKLRNRGPGSAAQHCMLRSARDTEKLKSHFGVCSVGSYPPCRARRSPGTPSPAAEPGAGLMPNHFSWNFAMVPSSFMHSIAFSIVLRSSPESFAQGRRPYETGGVQVGQFELRIVLHRPGDVGVAGDVGVGAAGEHGLHGVALRPEALDLPADLGFEIARP